jgi:hypothetical protein
VLRRDEGVPGWTDITRIGPRSCLTSFTSVTLVVARRLGIVRIRGIVHMQADLDSLVVLCMRRVLPFLLTMIVLETIEHLFVLPCFNGR